jgi:hypothetical protein
MGIMSFVFSLSFFLTSYAYAEPIQYDSPFQIKIKSLGPQSSDITAFYFKEPLKKGDPGFLLFSSAKQQQSALKKLKASHAILLFSNDLAEPGVSFDSKEEVSFQIKQELEKHKVKVGVDHSVIILNKSANEFNFSHEIQHAEDFRKKIKEALRLDILKAMKIEEGYLPDDITSAFLEWRGYSRQILELEIAKKNDDISQVISSYSQGGYQQKLSDFYEAVKTHSPQLVAEICSVYRKFFISNKYLTLESISPDCKK